jgi:hypothetical protein
MAVKLPPRRLTKQQFLHKHPKGTYQNYVNAYTRQHGGPHGPSAAGRPNQPFAGPTYESLLRGLRFETPAQLEARANRMANQGIKSQQAIIREEAKLMRDEALKRMNAMAAAGRAAAAQNAGLFGMVGGEYNAAAGEIANLGTNLSNQMVHTTEADVLAQNAGLATVGAPEMAVGGPAGVNSIAGPHQGDVSAYQFGRLPAQAISTAGEASQFGLAGMVSAQNLRATQEALGGYRTAVGEADAARRAALKELAAGRPAQASQFLTQLMEAQDRQRELAMSLLAARQTFGLQNQENKRATAAARQDRATSITNRQLARQQAKMAGRELDEEMSRALGHYVDKMGRPIKGKNGQNIPYKPEASAATTGQWTAPEKRAEMSRQLSYFLKDSYDKRGRLTRTQAQAVKFMSMQFPGTPIKLIKQYVAAGWPKTPKGSAAGGGDLGAQP